MNWVSPASTFNSIHTIDALRVHITLRTYMKYNDSRGIWCHCRLFAQISIHLTRTLII